MTEMQIGMITGACTTFAGVAITSIVQLIRTKSEEKRAYAAQLLGRKLDALSTLYDALVHCHSALNFYGNCPPHTHDEYRQKVESKVESFRRAWALAFIYLGKCKEATSKAIGAFNQASMAVFLHLPQEEIPKVLKGSYADLKGVREVDWKGLSEAYQAGVACLEKMLNPKSLERFSSFD